MLPPGTPVAQDLVRAAADGTIAAMPLPGHEWQQVVDVVEAGSVEQFMALNTNMIAPEERRAVLGDAGFVRSVDVSYVYEADHYSVHVMEFASEQGALDYFDVHVGRICRDALGLRPLDVPVGGVIYDRITEGQRFPRALAVIGRYEVAVSVCQCVGVADLAAVGGSWMRAIAELAANGTPA